MLQTKCYNCDKDKPCANVPDIGFICADCRGDFPPPAHVMEQIVKDQDNG